MRRVLVKPNFNTADATPGSTHNDTLRALVRRLRILSVVHGAGEWPHAEWGPLLDLAERVVRDGGPGHDRFAISDWGENRVVIADAKGKVLGAIGSAWPGDDRPVFAVRPGPGRRARRRAPGIPAGRGAVRRSRQIRRRRE